MTDGQKGDQGTVTDLESRSGKPSTQARLAHRGDGLSTHSNESQQAIHCPGQNSHSPGEPQRFAPSPDLHAVDNATSGARLCTVEAVLGIITEMFGLRMGSH